MKKLSKFKLILSVAIFIVTIVLIVLVLNKSNSSPLYEERFYGATGKIFGYVIYYNGTIQKYDKSMSAKISNNELKQLKQLSIEVEYNENDYETTALLFNMAGGSISKIYNSRKSQWIILGQVSSKQSKRNVSKASMEIRELTDRLYNKYLKN